ncbi:hypothetical protein OG417_50920 [Actinoallomurus sp. NBC_01490]|jgi:hypothetical protein|uniref:hypothetical protein n=1 Tax=Actinoallomurus sp. NBC_01490 TaxID=2903557 RepID=UPI002E37E1D0|nr:hypothetical protein [Actinoallomurus sp. NBC_01490]
MRLIRRCITAALAIGVIGTTTAAFAESSSAAPSTTPRAAASEGQEIGSAALGTDLKVSLRAYKTGDTDALVDVDAYRYSEGAWQPVWHERVPGNWFWYPLTGKGGVCSLAVTNEGAITVSLLITPSIGCSDPLHFTVD